MNVDRSLLHRIPTAQVQRRNGPSPGPSAGLRREPDDRRGGRLSRHQRLEVARVGPTSASSTQLARPEVRHRLRPATVELDKRAAFDALPCPVVRPAVPHHAFTSDVDRCFDLHATTDRRRARAASALVACPSPAEAWSNGAADRAGRIILGTRLDRRTAACGAPGTAPRRTRCPSSPRRGRSGGRRTRCPRVWRAYIVGVRGAKAGGVTCAHRRAHARPRRR